MAYEYLSPANGFVLTTPSGSWLTVGTPKRTPGSVTPLSSLTASRRAPNAPSVLASKT